jgi:hypothetical protein
VLLLAPLLIGLVPFYADHAAQRRLPRAAAGTAALAVSAVVAFLVDIVHAGRVSISLTAAASVVLACIGVHSPLLYDSPSNWHSAGTFVALSPSDAADSSAELEESGGLPLARRSVALGQRAQSCMHYVMGTTREREGDKESEEKVNA